MCASTTRDALIKKISGLVAGTKREAAQGDARGPRGDAYLCCNNNVDAGMVVQFGPGVEGGSVTELGGCFGVHEQGLMRMKDV